MIRWLVLGDCGVLYGFRCPVNVLKLEITYLKLVWCVCMCVFSFSTLVYNKGSITHAIDSSSNNVIVAVAVAVQWLGYVTDSN